MLRSSSRWSMICAACVIACARQPVDEGTMAPASEPALTGSGAVGASVAQPGAPVQRFELPASAEEAEARLAASPRHGEWVTIPAGRDSIRAWVVYSERSVQSPVIIVIHEIFGLSHWIRAVADQLAADGFIAIAPDLLTTKNLPGAPADTPPDAARAAISTLQPADVQRWLDATARWGMAHPAARPTYGVVGFCWGGAAVFNHAVHANPALGAAVVYYGSSPASTALATVRAPVLGLYGADDARVNATVPAADSAMRALGRVFEPHFFAGAGHGFLRQQNGRDGANLAATRQAWPLTVGWFRRHLERR